MLKFCCFITGDEYNLIKDETPLSRKKIRLFAISIIIPVLMWGINSYLLVSQVLHKSISAAIITSIISMIIIFVIEKSIVMSNGSRVIAIFRLFLGLTIAILGSLGFDEVIFQNDIDTQMAENKREFIESSMIKFKSELAIKNFEKEKELSELKNQWDAAVSEAIKEADGTGGTGNPNVGKITQLKLLKADEKRASYEISKFEQINYLILQDSLIKSKEEILGNSYNENSLLLRIKALFDLVSKDGWMKWSYILFTFLIVLLESMVILIKLFSKETNFEKKMKMIEQIGEKRMKSIIENSPHVYDQIIFKNDIRSSRKILERPMNGIYK